MMAVNRSNFSSVAYSLFLVISSSLSSITITVWLGITQFITSGGKCLKYFPSGFVPLLSGKICFISSTQSSSTECITITLWIKFVKCTLCSFYKFLINVDFPLQLFPKMQQNEEDLNLFLSNSMFLNLFSILNIFGNNKPKC